MAREEHAVAKEERAVGEEEHAVGEEEHAVGPRECASAPWGPWRCRLDDDAPDRYRCELREASLPSADGLLGDIPRGLEPFGSRARRVAARCADFLVQLARPRNVARGAASALDEHCQIVAAALVVKPAGLFVEPERFGHVDIHPVSKFTGSARQIAAGAAAKRARLLQERFGADLVLWSSLPVE